LYLSVLWTVCACFGVVLIVVGLRGDLLPKVAIWVLGCGALVMALIQLIIIRLSAKHPLFGWGRYAILIVEVTLFVCIVGAIVIGFVYGAKSSFTTIAPAPIALALFGHLLTWLKDFLNCKCNVFKSILCCLVLFACFCYRVLESLFLLRRLTKKIFQYV
jgi:lysylphosphatidylglycerol synthetase-like protein (DUF2156 family)